MTPYTLSGSVCEFDNMVTELQSAQSSRHRVEKKLWTDGGKVIAKAELAFSFNKTV